MTETEFLSLAETIFSKIETQVDQWFEHLDLDIDASRNGAVLSLTFANRQQAIINTQAPLQEIWLAAPSGAWHYQFHNGHWEDTRGELNLAQRLSKVCSELSQHPLTIEL
ncbi:iron donor protein CyaY [Basilea psittacipulmonis]|uniref:Iron-sulfur cluster assembly protein CyaY n=1 Tax=Basilea psittacipulmonis DSM 24701 TaxID=1072685 RepID=A0A077DB47_9BURK|nr:iron donor protein CyaY [Basilea psittacipulmonis]AIL32105.1 frataxin [Basilea psittacipulmonis DSM 24701]